MLSKYIFDYVANNIKTNTQSNQTRLVCKTMMPLATTTYKITMTLNHWLAKD